MQNSFWIGSRISDFLFKDFSTHTLAGFIAICFGLSALAVLYELLLVYQILLKQTSGVWRHGRSRMVHTLPHRRLYSRLFQTLLYTAQVLLSYILMLSVMTYNTYFTASVVLGGGIGYFLLSNSVLELRDFGGCDNFADDGSNNSPSAGRGSRAAGVLKTVAEDISDSVLAGGSNNLNNRSTTPEIVTA
ncbi:probable low affinity copper uptake protein 2 [Schistocerca serialis cubense]|uniref:probable low affinity copper uptake protein 2 n=1 Tax=Schistocerca serialis cubense TaxID=2023355 RepID=UPI00214E5B15|nr:probable low affinity copper uptake protein 2 [Schistocerca serialis cubense]